MHKQRKMLHALKEVYIKKKEKKIKKLESANVKQIYISKAYPKNAPSSVF